MNRYGAIGVVLLTFLLTASFGRAQSSRDQVSAKLDLTTESMFSKLKTENNLQYWEGTQELHPMWDVLFYITLKKVDREPSEILRDVLARVKSWQLPNGTWGFTRSGATSIDVTATMLLSLQHLGITDQNEPSLRAAWQWWRAKTQGQKSAPPVNIIFKIFMTLTGVLPRETIPPFPTKIIGLHEGMPMSVADLGIFRTLLIPIVVWDFYEDQKNSELADLDPARIRSAGDEMASMPVDAKFKSLVNKPTDVILNLLGSDWNNFAERIFGVESPVTDDFWAQEGIGWVLARKQKSGGWYTLGNTLVSLIALYEADHRGIDRSGTLRKAINDGIAAMMKWRQIGSDEAGHPYTPASRSSIWDSALTLQNIARLAPEKQAAHQAQIESTIKYLIDGRSEELGDWSRRNPLAKGTFAGWAFFPEATFYPDTDCTAAALEVLMDFKVNPALEIEKNSTIKKGFTWLLAMQNRDRPNDDGGFPAWEKNNSRQSYDLMRGLLKGIPRVSDFSQPDVTARILRALAKARSTDEYKNLVTNDTIEEVCSYLKNSVQSVPSQAGQIRAWEGDWITDYTYGTAEVVAGLMQAARVDANCASLADVDPYVRWFKKIQNTDGGWGESNDGYGVVDSTSGEISAPSFIPAASTIVQTNFVMKALLRYEEFYRAKNAGQASPYFPSIAKGAEFLLKKESDKGELAEHSFTAVYIKGYLFSDYSLMPQYHAIGALADYLKLLPATTPAARP